MCETAVKGRSSTWPITYEDLLTLCMIWYFTATTTSSEVEADHCPPFNILNHPIADWEGGDFIQFNKTIIKDNRGRLTERSSTESC